MVPMTTMWQEEARGKEEKEKKEEEEGERGPADRGHLPTMMTRGRSFCLRPMALKGAWPLLIITTFQTTLCSSPVPVHPGLMTLSMPCAVMLG